MIPLQPPSYFISGHQGMVSRDMWFSSRYQPQKIKNVFFKKKKIVVRNQSCPSLLHSFYKETGALSERMKLLITYSRRIQPSKSNLNNEALYWLFLKQVACAHKKQMEDKTIDNLSRWSQQEILPPEAWGIPCSLSYRGVPPPPRHRHIPAWPENQADIWSPCTTLLRIHLLSFPIQLWSHFFCCVKNFFPSWILIVLRNARTLFCWFLSLSSSKRRHYQAPLLRLCTDYIIHPLTTFQTFTFTIHQVLILRNVCLQASFYINVYTNCWWIWTSGRR